MRGTALVLAVVVVGGIVLAAPSARALGASGVVLAKFAAVESAIEASGLSPKDVRPLTAKLDAARMAAENGRWRASLGALEALSSGLSGLPLPPTLRDDVDALRAMVVFEMLFGPIPEASADRMPYPFQLHLLGWILADLAVEAPRPIADGCVGQMFPLPSFVILAPGGPHGPPQDPQLDDQMRNEFKKAAKEVLTDIKDKVTGKTTGSPDAGAAKKGNTTVRPRCEVDNAKIANASAAGGVTVDVLKSAVTSIGVQVTHTFATGDLTGSLTGGIDITDPWGDRGWRLSGALELGGRDSWWGASLGGFYDSSGGFGVSGGFKIRF